MNNQEQNNFARDAQSTTYPGANISPFDQSDACPSGNDPAMLAQIEGLNWGAFLWGWIWIWPINNMWALVTMVALAVLSTLTGGLAELALRVYLLLKGNRFAWKFRPFRDVEEFHAVQAAWLKWGLLWIVISILMAIGVVILFGGFFMAMLAGGMSR